MKETSHIVGGIGIAVLCGWLFSTQGQAALYPDTVLGMNPVGYWRLEALGPLKIETGHNSGSLGAAADGQYIGAPNLQQPGVLAGDPNTAVEFTGGMMLEVPWSSELNPQPPFTIECWVKPNVAMTGNSLASPLASLHREPPRAEGWIFYQTPSGWNFRLGDSQNNYTANLTGTTTITPGQWYHLVVTYDGNTVTLYVNGKAEATAQTSNYAPNPDQPLGIGARGDHAFWFNGVVDEVAIYTKVLSQDTIQAHYNNALDPNRTTPYDQLILSDNPIAYWRLNDPPNRTESVNLGSLGEDYNAVYQPGSNPGQIGPQAPINPGFESDNVAVELDGISGHVIVNKPLDLYTNTVTITCWIQPYGNEPAWAGIVFCRGGDTVAGIDYHGDSGNLGYHWNDLPSTYNWDSGLQPLDYCWNFVALVVQPDKAVMYLYDGFQMMAATNAIPHDLEEFNGPLRFGLDTGNRFYSGVIDEVAVFNRALTPGEIYTLAYAGFGSSEPPQILTQPTAPTEPLYEEGSFSLYVDAAGEPPLTFQWRKNGQPIEGATNRVFIIESARVEDSGQYDVVVTNLHGSTTSNPITITVKATEVPTITQQPQNVKVYAGGRAVFYVQATGATYLSYQWKFNGQEIEGATNATLVITDVQPEQAGDYTVVVTSSAGSTESQPATLTVITFEEYTYPWAVMQDHPLAYWRLGEIDGTNAFDYAGGHTGNYINNPILGMPGAIKDDPDTAVGFFPDNQTYVDIPNAPEFNGQQFTIECWVRVNPDTTGWRSPVTHRNGPAAEGWCFYAGQNDRWQFWVGRSGGSWAQLQGPQIEEDQWAYLVGTYDGTTARFYVNGALVAETQTPYVPNMTYSFHIGAGSGPGGAPVYFFDGDVDEVAFYDYALTPDQVQLHYAAAMGSGTPPSITQQPESVAVLEGETATFSVVAAGSLPLTYQWQFNGQEIPGATNKTLTIENVTPDQAGTYTVVIKNPAGTITSQPATLDLVQVPTEPYSQIVKNDGPVAYWRLGETSGTTAVDEMGVHPGTYMNGVILGVPGAIANDSDTAAQFSAAAHTKVEVPYSPDLNTDQFTIECWAMVTGGQGTYRSPVTSRADFPQRGYIIYAAMNDTWQLWLGTGNGWGHVVGPAVELNKWYHLVGTYDGSVARFYVNGRLVGQGEMSFSPNDEAVFRIGAGATENPDGNYFFEGVVDEVACYNKVLTPVQILTHYAAGQPPLKPPTLSIERTDQGIVITWENGTLQQAPTINGPWTDVEGATSPLTVQPTEKQMFFRVIQR